MKILVAEGNDAAMRRTIVSIAGKTPGERYAEVLCGMMPGLDVDICCPADSASGAPAGLAEYDGVVITGSALSAYRDIPEVRRQVEFSRAVFSAGIPFLGSCWGLQIATVAAGGEVSANVAGVEVGYARKVSLTDAGAAHPMHKARDRVFDAPAIHGDHVTRLPENSVVTARNAFSAIQAAEIRHDNGTFWGVQYHPEFDFRDIGDVLVRYKPRLLGLGLFQTETEMDAYICDIYAIHEAPDRKDLAWRYDFGTDLLNGAIRGCEIANWLEHARCGSNRG